MKLIDRFLMGFNAAIMDAALTAHVSWLDQLLAKFECDASKPLIAAASKGLQNVARYLLCTAAGNGHLDVVQYMVQRARENKYVNNRSAALARAITGRHTNVVEFLFNLVAVGTTQYAHAKRIFDIYAKKNSGKNMFVHLAGGGYANAVMYMYGRGCKVAEVVTTRSFAQQLMARPMSFELLKINTGRITAISVDNAFETAAGLAGVVYLETVFFLCRVCRASSESISNVSANADSPKATRQTRQFHKNERISDKAVIKAFVRAAECGGNVSSDSRDRNEIVKLLSKEECIPTEIICKAFVAAATNGNTDVVNHLRVDRRISSEAKSEISQLQQVTII
ncbi:Ankyrin repeat-containing domain [Phytophthora cactorum]|nr:Ankyrin repeat-containing domain [Phytophthora cactorum]